MDMGYPKDDESAINGSNPFYNDIFYYNDTYYYNDTTVEESRDDSGPLPPPYPKPTAVVIAQVFAFVMNIVVTIIGNTTVILVIFRNKKKNMRSATYYYLMNLAIADLIVACFSEWTLLTGLLRPGSWPFGAFMCKFTTFMQALSVHVGIMTLLVVAGDRYIAIVHPIRSRVTKRKVWHVITAVWIFSAAVDVPLILYQHHLVFTWGNGEVRQYCFEFWGVLGEDEHLVLAKELYGMGLFLLFYVAPLVLISVAYVRIGMKLRHQSVGRSGVVLTASMSVRNKRRKRVVKIMIVVVTTFALCWLPYHVYVLYAQYKGIFMDWNIFAFVIWLGYANSAMNPFIYCGFSENFKQVFRNALTGRCCRKALFHQRSSSQYNFDDGVQAHQLHQSNIGGVHAVVDTTSC